MAEVERSREHAQSESGALDRGMGFERLQSRFFQDFSPGMKLPHPPIAVHPLTHSNYLNDFDPQDRVYGNQGALNFIQCDRPFRFAKGGGIAAPRWIWHDAIGSGVDDLSLNLVANRGYTDVWFYRPVPVSAPLYPETTVLGLRAKAQATSGNVLVETVIYDESGDAVAMYRRTPLIKCREGTSIRTEIDLSALPMPDQLALIEPPLFSRIPKELLGDYGRVFEEFKVGHRFLSTRWDGVTGAAAMSVPSATRNTARGHRDDVAGRLVYGPTVVDLALNQLRGIFPVMWEVGMPEVTHTAPLFPRNVFFSDTAYGLALNALPKGYIPSHELVHGSLQVLETTLRPGRDDGGFVTFKLTAEKMISPEGVKLLELADGGNFKGALKRVVDGKLPILEMKLIAWIPTAAAIQA